MKMPAFPSDVTDWGRVESKKIKGKTGTALWKTRTFGDIRVRMVEFSPGYAAEEWCVKGHVVLCLEGELSTEIQGGAEFILKPGMTYQVADNDPPHRSRTEAGAKLFIVD